MTGAEFKALLKEAGLSQSNIARALNVPVRTVHRWTSDTSLRRVNEFAVRFILQTRNFPPL